MINSGDTYVYANQSMKTTLFGDSGGGGEGMADDVDYSFAPELPFKTTETAHNNNCSDVINAMEMLEQQAGQSGDPKNVYDFEMPVVGDGATDEAGPTSLVTSDSGVETLVMQDNDVYEASNITNDEKDVYVNVNNNKDNTAGSPNNTGVPKINNEITSPDDVIFVENDVYE